MNHTSTLTHFEKSFKYTHVPFGCRFFVPSPRQSIKMFTEHPTQAKATPDRGSALSCTKNVSFVFSLSVSLPLFVFYVSPRHGIRCRLCSQLTDNEIFNKQTNFSYQIFIIAHDRNNILVFLWCGYPVDSFERKKTQFSIFRPNFQYFFELSRKAIKYFLLFLELKINYTIY